MSTFTFSMSGFFVPLNAPQLGGSSTSLLAFCHQYHRLYVRRMGEHIHGLDVAHDKAFVPQMAASRAKVAGLQDT